MSGSVGAEWLVAASASELDADYPVMATVAGVEMALCLEGGEVFALANICTHAFARLSDGHVEDGQVFCPLHQGSFDLRTGEAKAAPCFEPVKTFPARIVGEEVMVRLS